MNEPSQGSDPQDALHLERQRFLDQCEAAYVASRTLPLLECEADVFGGWGLPLKDGKPALPLETNFGWAQGFVDRLVEQGLSCAEVKSPRSILQERVALLSFPGAFTYGHWIIDIAARLETLTRFYDMNSLKFIVPALFPWAKPVLGAYGISDDRLVVVEAKDSVFCRRLVVPALLRVNDYLPEDPHRDSLARLRRHGEALCPKIGDPLRLFVRHVAQTSSGVRASLGNTEEIENLLARYGFVSITPADMSIEAQIETFQRASLIIGEDSSALHNCVWSRGAPTLIVLSSPARHNILHEGMTRLLDQTCVYMYGTMSSDHFFEISAGGLETIVNSVVSS